VVNPARGERYLAGALGDDLIGHLERELAREHIERLVPTVMVERRPLPGRRNRILEESDEFIAVLASSPDDDL